MNSLILNHVSRIVLPLSLVYSLYLLWKGHNEPGGGFVAGLVLSAGIAAFALPRGRDATLKLIPLSPLTIASIGIIFALISAVIRMPTGKSILTHYWFHLSETIHVGTALLFDVGVFLTVIGTVLTYLISYMDV